jgi:hypothetical protein
LIITFAAQNIKQMVLEKKQGTNEKQKALISALKKSSDEEVMAMLIDLKEQGELFYVRTLLEILSENRSELLNKALVEYLSDIKLQDAVKIISDFVSENYADKDVNDIVVVSWQSRLDFSKHLNPYIQILINANYKTAFEAFTVIENSIDSLSADELTQYGSTIKKAVQKSNRDKQLLLLEMISVLEKAKRAIE